MLKIYESILIHQIHHSVKIKYKVESIFYKKKCVIFVIDQSQAQFSKVNSNSIDIWRSPSLSELTPYWILFGLTHVGLKVFNWYEANKVNLDNFIHFLVLCFPINPNIAIFSKPIKKDNYLTFGLQSIYSQNRFVFLPKLYK